MVWPRHNVCWFSKDVPLGHSERKKKRQTGEVVGRQCPRPAGMDFARAAENRTRWKWIVTTSTTFQNLKKWYIVCTPGYENKG